MKKATKSKKEIIFEEAVSLFREMGYVAASMRILANRIGLKPSSFYSHFKSKEEILQKICFDNAHLFLAGIDLIETSFDTPTQQIKALIQLHVQTAVEKEASIFVFNDEWRHLQEPHLGDFLNLRKNYETRFIKIIEAGMSDGSFVQINSSIALNTILTSIRWIYNWQNPMGKISANDLAADITKLILNGLEK